MIIHFDKIKNEEIKKYLVQNYKIICTYTNFFVLLHSQWILIRSHRGLFVRLVRKN